MKLPAPVYRFPVTKGLYEVAPNLKDLKDEKIFEFDSEFHHSLANKKECREESLPRYVARENLDPLLEQAVFEFIAERLCQEWPDLFSWTPKRELHAKLTQNKISSHDSNHDSNQDSKTLSLWEKIGFEVQEDLAVLCTKDGPEGKTNWLAALHLCAPSHWSAEEKIGKSFNEIHEPVAGISKLLKASDYFVDAMVNQGPYTRMVWGIERDGNLNQHPSRREFNQKTEARPGDFGNYFLRFERQVIWGFPQWKASLFTIRTYLRKLSELDSQEKKLLASGLLSMKPENLSYKRLTSDRDLLVAWLEREASR